ncbi:MAG TPA: alpha/beta hydrolase [Flavisolibacter sp.]|jgi:pimeloyl-ACP methyl ester carboxylesterase|nr:alpha/beta hydrolase [Flavisolibacter sp.]
METKRTTHKGKNISYRTRGKGAPVILLHGFGEDGSIWKGQYELFPQHQLIVPDLPGTGDSEALEDMRLESMADAVKAVIDAEGGEKAVLIGHSMGGYITLAFAERYPEALNAFGLFHSTAFADSEEKKETRQKGIRFIKEHGAAEFLKTATPNLYSPQSREEHPEWIAEHLAATHNFSPDTLVNYYMAMINRPDRTAVLEESKVPVLFVMGRHDAAAPLQDVLKQCHLPRLSYIHILDNSGHMGMIEEKNKTAELLSTFVFTLEKTA